jgi:hypothetical protein
MRMTALALGAVAAMMATAPASADLGQCPTGWQLSSSPVGVAPDYNRDGWVCVGPNAGLQVRDNTP